MPASSAVEEKCVLLHCLRACIAAICEILCSAAGAFNKFQFGGVSWASLRSARWSDFRKRGSGCGPPFTDLNGRSIIDAGRAWCAIYARGCGSCHRGWLIVPSRSSGCSICSRYGPSLHGSLVDTSHSASSRNTHT